MTPRDTNVLFVVLDQMRADCLHGALADAALSQNPNSMSNIRALMDDGVSFTNHVSVTSPCGPARASILTGQYAMNHHSVRNGTPLAHDKPNLARSLRAGGYQALLYGYTDTSPDPREYNANDPVLTSYEQVLPGFFEALEMRFDDSRTWRGYLAAKGYDVPSGKGIYVPDGPQPNSPAIYKAEHSDTAYLTDRLLQDLPTRGDGWCAHVTYIRPHPPFVAPAPYNTMFSAKDMPPPAGGEASGAHPFDVPAINYRQLSDMIVGFPDIQPTPENIAAIRAIYMGLANEVDHHFGRIISYLKESGQYENTLIVVTADHGEMLGDYSCWGKVSYFDAAFRTPLIIRLPDNRGNDDASTTPLAAGSRVSLPTESIDITPTILDVLGLDIPDSMDGRSLLPILAGTQPDDWRRYSVSELDFGDPVNPTIWQRELGLSSAECNLTILRTDTHNLIHFGGELPQILFDHKANAEGIDISDAPGSDALRLGHSEMLLSHKMIHSRGLFSQTMITESGAVRGEF